MVEQEEWAIYVVDEVRDFIRTRDTKTRDRINDAIDALAENGPGLAVPPWTR